MHLQPGHVMGLYQIDSEIGHGGRAVIYRACQRTTGRWVALKVLRKRDPRALEDFRREAQLTANIGHSSVRQVYDAGQTPDGYPFLAMQFVDTSLRQFLRAYQEQGRTFSRQEVARILEPVADVLDHIHSKGIVHLDIKPENILIFEDGQVVLADFGSAHQIGSTTHEGTPSYFSPEQAAGDRPVTPQSDIYSLAIVAYEMLTGQLPFGGEMDIVLVRQHLDEAPRPLCQANPRLPRDLEKVVGEALSKDPRRRPAAARCFVEEIRTAGEPRPAPGRRKRNARGGLGRWGLLIPAAAMPIVLLLGTLFVVWPMLKTTPTPTPTFTPTITPSPSATATPTSTPSPIPTETLAPTATPRPTSTPRPTRPPPTWTPTPAPSAGGAQPISTGTNRPAIAMPGCFAHFSRGATPRSPAQGDAHG